MCMVLVVTKAEIVGLGDERLTSVDSSARAALPSGWRLTKHGWEHTSTWTLSNASINQLIAAQRDREPAWIRFGFSKLRSIPPLMVALLQITAVAVITNIAKNHRQRGKTADAS